MEEVHRHTVTDGVELVFDWDPARRRRYTDADGAVYEYVAVALVLRDETGLDDVREQTVRVDGYGPTRSAPRARRGGPDPAPEVTGAR